MRWDLFCEVIGVQVWLETVEKLGYEVEVVKKTHLVLWVETEKWIRIKKGVGLKQAYWNCLRKKMSWTEEFRKQEKQLELTFYHKDWRNLWHQSFRRGSSAWSMYFDRRIRFSKMCIQLPEKISLFQFSCWCLLIFRRAYSYRGAF